MSDYPEHEKLKLISDKSQACGEFLEWLASEKGITLATKHEHDSECRGPSRLRVCGFTSSQLEPVYIPRTALLAEFFDIDERKIEKEKRAMLDALRKEK